VDIMADLIDDQPFDPTAWRCMADRQDNTITRAFRAPNCRRAMRRCGGTYGGRLALARHCESGGAGATSCPRLRGSRLLPRVAVLRKGQRQSAPRRVSASDSYR
jgi:hypothetical protein